MIFLNKIYEIFRNTSKLKRILYSLALLMFLFLLSVALSPLNKTKELKNLVYTDSLFVEKYDNIYHHSALTSSVREKSYKEALLRLHGSDSIQLSINLMDSTVRLFIKGVKIHETIIKQFEQDGLLGKLPNMQYAKIFSSPLEIKSQHATIIKEPVVVRHAPKDPAEAALTAWEPDTLIQEPAFLLMHLEHGIDVVFEQESNTTFHDNWVKFIFNSKIRINKSIVAVGRFLFLRKQEYHPTIKIKLPVNDLRAIYRALPHHARLALYCP